MQHVAAINGDHADGEVLLLSILVLVFLKN